MSTTHPRSEYSEEMAMELHAELCGASWKRWNGTSWFACDNDEERHVFWRSEDVFFCRPAMEGACDWGSIAAMMGKP